MMITHGVIDKHGYDVILDITSTTSGYHSSGSSCMSSSTTSTSLSSATSSASNSLSSANWQYHINCCCCPNRNKNRFSNATGLRVLAWALAVAVFVGFYWFGGSYMKSLLLWIETQNPWLTFCVFQLAFAIVSFPVVVGYLILIITSGYLFGCAKGVVTVVIGANVGAAIAQHTIHVWQSRLPIQR